MSYTVLYMFDRASVESFKSSLDAHYNWPSVFPFKFIVPAQQANQVIELLNTDHLESRDSSNGRFVAFTLEKEVQSSDEVVALYETMSHIPGIITL